jgi:hypothetical protein
MAFLCVSQQVELKHQKKLFWGSPCQKKLAEKVEEKNCFLSSLAVSLHKEPKNTIKIFAHTTELCVKWPLPQWLALVGEM